jgi:hypothetical protein
MRPKIYNLTYKILKLKQVQNVIQSISQIQVQNKGFQIRDNASLKIHIKQN